MSAYDLDTAIKAVAEAEGHRAEGYWRVEIDDPDALDPRWLKQQPDKSRIRKHLQGGGEIPGVRLVWAYSVVPEAK